MKRMKVFGALLALLLILVAVAPIVGQDGTAAPDMSPGEIEGWQTWVADGEAAMTATAVGLAEPEVPDAPVIVNVEATPNADETTVLEVASWVSIGVTIGLLAYRFFFAKSDAERVAAVRAAQDNRVGMKELENQYQRAREVDKVTINALIGVLAALKGLIPGKADDALLDLWRDVQVPGAPPPEEGAPTGT